MLAFLLNLRRVSLPLMAWAAATVSVAPGAASAAEAPPSERSRSMLRERERPLDRFFDLSIGADYPGTLIRPDSQAQLKIAVDELGFRYIRFHDIFHDVLGTVRVVDGRTVYDWSKIDRLYDDLLSKGIRPFVELGFTPQAMTTSAQTIFYWKGNTSHPKLGPWRDLIDAFVRHVRERYGVAEVRQWYFEVWNEPNLDGFWERADQQAYFDLYAVTARDDQSDRFDVTSRRPRDCRRGLGSGVPGIRAKNGHAGRLRDHSCLWRRSRFLGRKRSERHQAFAIAGRDRR